MKNRFYLACTRDNVGDNVAFHALDGKGYTTNIAKAHIYTRAEAQAQWDRGREFDLPLSADHVDALTIEKVDHQYIPTTSFIPDGCERFVVFHTHSRDGNDVAWLTDLQRFEYDFSKARVFNREEITNIDRSVVIIPFEMADKQKRKTISISKINKRVMTQGAGLKTPRHIHLSSRRRPSSKVRWNCPRCGKIVWQYNPHDFDTCSDPHCY